MQQIPKHCDMSYVTKMRKHLLTNHANEKPNDVKIKIKQETLLTHPLGSEVSITWGYTLVG